MRVHHVIDPAQFSILNFFSSRLEKREINRRGDLKEVRYSVGRYFSGGADDMAHLKARGVMHRKAAEVTTPVSHRATCPKDEALIRAQVW